LRELSTARRVRSDVLAQRCRRLRIELAIEIRIEVAFHKFATHRRVSLGALSFSIVCSRSRARACRDMTVPIGTPATSAISL
jgi:hypothetical protein